MRATLIIPDAVYRALKARAAEAGRTISGLATEFIRRGLEAPDTTTEPEPLPTFDAGRVKVDPARRAALYDAMDRPRDLEIYGPEGG